MNGDSACAEIGRDPATLGRSASVVVNLPMMQGQDGQPEPTSPEDVAEVLRGYAREGLSHVQLWLVPQHHRRSGVVRPGPQSAGSRLSVILTII